jgi:hypothetical protein
MALPTVVIGDNESKVGNEMRSIFRSIPRSFSASITRGMFCSRYRTPPWTSFVLALDVPCQSRCAPEKNAVAARSCVDSHPNACRTAAYDQQIPGPRMLH